jgi:AhpD family alkylhydroperoxidase
MQPRIDYTQAAPGTYKAMLGLEQYLHHSELGPLLHLTKFRVSQINGCAYCLDMHSKDLRSMGETETAPLLARCLARVSLLHGPRARSVSLG